MHSLPRATWSRKRRCHGVRYANTEEQKEYHIAWNAWKRCCKKVDSQGGHFYKYSRSISQRSSLSWITTRNRMVRTKVQRVGWTCGRPYIQTRSRVKTKIQRTMVSHSEEKHAKMGPGNFDLITEPLSWWKIACTTNQEKPLKSPSIQVDKDEYNKDKKFSLKIHFFSARADKRTGWQYWPSPAAIPWTRQGNVISLETLKLRRMNLLQDSSLLVATWTQPFLLLFVREFLLPS